MPVMNGHAGAAAVAFPAALVYPHGMQPVSFLKMHGLGNDFVVLDERSHVLGLKPADLRRVADRHRGVGCDQLVSLGPSTQGDVRLTFFNADGSLAESCGNATRCVARLLMDELGQSEVTLETPAGLLPARRLEDGRVAVQMPEPLLGWQDIPVREACDTLVMPLEVEGLGRPVGVSMGNPHAVFFTDDVEKVDITGLGAPLERDPFFPERANIGFATVLDRSTLRLRVFERGAGLTLACGSGACAAMVAAVRRGLVEPRATVILDGGPLEIAWGGKGRVEMIGPTSHSFSGTLSAELLHD
jgi:diaminopimelate epimerase